MKGHIRNINMKTIKKIKITNFRQLQNKLLLFPKLFILILN